MKKNDYPIVNFMAPVAVILAIKFYMVSQGFFTSVWFYNFFPLELGFFIAGAIGYRAYRFMVKRNLTDRPECKWIAAASLLTILYALWGDMSDMSIYWISTIATAICLPFLFSVSRNNRIDRLIGNISYPVYISHMAVIIAAKHIIGKFQDEKTGILLDNKIGIVIVVCVLLISVLAYYAVERPIDRFRHRRFPTHPSTPATATDSGL